MQTSAAFVQVQLALNWLVDNYIRIAEWLASVRRVVGLWGALDELDRPIGRDPRRAHRRRRKAPTMPSI